MTFRFQKYRLFKIGITFGKEWGPNRETFGLLLYFGTRALFIWFGKDPWKIEPSPLTIEELERAEDD